MNKIIRIFVTGVLMIVMIMGIASTSYAATDPLNEKMATYSMKESQAVVDYLQEVYTDKYPQMALESMYLTTADEKTLKSLSNRIVGTSTADSEKISKIVKWVECNIEYESESEGYPMDVLYHGKANCWGYAQLITALARCQNIPCVPISGFRGNLSMFTYNEALDMVGHAWVYAYYGGKWRLYDPLFGVYNKTDLDFISKWYKTGTVEGMFPVYKGQNLKRANAFSAGLYINGKFMLYSSGKPASQVYGSGVEDFFDINEFCYPIRPYFNGYPYGEDGVFTGYSGKDYADEPIDEKLGMSVRKSKMVNDECFTGSWITDGLKLYYMRENGVCLSNSIRAYKGNNYFLAFDGTAHAIESDNVTLYNGFITVPVGEKVTVFTPEWKSWDGHENDDGTVSKWHIVDDTPSIAHMTDSGVITGKKAGIATFYINCNYDNIPLQVRVVDKKPSVKTVSKVTARLSYATYTYTGKVKTPSVIVKNVNGDVMKKNEDYTVTYSTGRTKVGTYEVTIKGKGVYNFTKTLTFKINPLKTSITSLTKGSSSLTVKWSKKTTQTTGYEVQYSTLSTFKKGTATKTITVSGTSTTKKTVKNLKSGKKYYVRVRTYKTVDGVKYYSGWSVKKGLSV